MTKTLQVKITNVSRMARATLRNALRLHRDAIILFNARRFPSAYFISMSALEELGKLNILDDYVYHCRVDRPMETDYKNQWLGLVFQHRAKQNNFVSGSYWMAGINKRMMQEFEDGTIDRRKQDSLYVGLPRRGKHIDATGQITEPIAIYRDCARQQITIVNDYLLIVTTGVIHDVFIHDAAGLDRCFSKGLFRRLSEEWRHRNFRTRMHLKRIKKAKNG